MGAGGEPSTRPPPRQRLTELSTLLSGPIRTAAVADSFLDAAARRGAIHVEGRAQ
jgi:hypothetical protein